MMEIIICLLCFGVGLLTGIVFCNQGQKGDSTVVTKDSKSTDNEE